MARTTINSQGVPTGTIVASDLSYPLTNFSSTGIDDNATSTALTIDASERIGIGNTSPSYLIDARTASGNAQIYLRSGGDLGQLLLISNDTTGTSQINFGDADANNIGLISYSHNQNALKFTVNAAERMRIDSAGGLGIGTTNPTYKLVVSNNGEEGLEIDPVNDDQTIRSFYYDRNTSSYIINKSFADQHVWTAGGSSEKMRLNGSGNLGIGTTTPAEKLTVVGEILTGASASTSGQTILKSEYLSSSGDFVNILGTQRSSSAWVLGYGVEPDGSDAAVFNSTADNSSFARGALLVSDELVFSNAAASTTTVGSAITLTERIRIDSSGNVLVGKTSLGFTNVGFELRSGGDGRLYITNDNEASTVFRRNSSNGVISYYYQASNQVGLIGSEGSDSLYIGTSDTGLKFSASDIIQPFNPSTVAARDAAIDLGNSGARFKDIYLSGGAYLGGTGASNHLDDYEEGTWNPTITGSSGASGQTYSTQTGYYRKIGNVVHITYDVVLSNAGTLSGTYIVLGGLPFTTVGSNVGGGLVVAYSTGWASATLEPILAYISSGKAYLMEGGSTGSDYILTANNLHTSSSRLIGFGVLITS